MLQFLNRRTMVSGLRFATKRLRHGLPWGPQQCAFVRTGMAYTKFNITRSKQ